MTTLTTTRAPRGEQMPNDQRARRQRRWFSPPSLLVRLLGVWEIVTGLVAAASWAQLAISMRRDSLGLALIVIGGSLFALFSIAAGIGLVRLRPTGVMASLCVQALQVVGFASGNIVYQLMQGPYLDVTLIWRQRIAILLGIQPRLTLALNPERTGPGGIAVNLIACVLLWIVLAYRPDTPESQSR